MRDPKYFWVYMMANSYRGVIYTGVTSKLTARTWKHRNDVYDGFTSRYRLHRLVWFAECARAESAFRLETRMKRWRREWKFALIERDNPGWKDLWPGLVGENLVPVPDIAAALAEAITPVIPETAQRLSGTSLAGDGAKQERSRLCAPAALRPG